MPRGPFSREMDEAFYEGLWAGLVLALVVVGVIGFVVMIRMG